MSPILARKLGVHPNLEGKFLINVNFCKRAQSEVDHHLSEPTILDEV